MIPLIRNIQNMHIYRPKKKPKKRIRGLAGFGEQGKELLMGEGFLGICDENVMKSIVAKIVQLNKYTKNPLNCTL